MRDSAPLEGVGTQGWAQFMGTKFEMLAAFDKAKQEAHGHEVETYHGRVAEAEFRRWLAGFLPKRYGVTPGFIISQGIRDERKFPHFDVIIYDQLESPILWIEGSADTSEAGKSRAIPAEYVRAVIEVKASLNSKTATAAVAKLHDLDPLLAQFDAPNERYRKFLSATFCCAAVFFDLYKEPEYSQATMDNLVSDTPLRGYYGGLILRGEGLDRSFSGRFDFIQHPEVCIFEGGPPKRPLLLTGYSNGKPRPNGVHESGMLSWAPIYYSQFAFDLVARLQGAYQGGYMSSMHAMPWMVGAKPQPT
jgi:hypothetical protein